MISRSQAIEIFLLPAVPTEHLDELRQPHFPTTPNSLAKFLIITVITAPKNPGWKLERRHSICAGTVMGRLGQHLADISPDFSHNSLLIAIKFYMI